MKNPLVRISAAIRETKRPLQTAERTADGNSEIDKEDLKLGSFPKHSQRLDGGDRTGCRVARCPDFDMQTKAPQY